MSGNANFGGSMNGPTLSGITPVDNREDPFTESTARAEAFLQKKFDSMIEQMNKEIEEHNKNNPDDQRPLEEAVEVNLITARMSSKFYPFLLILPSSVLKDKIDHKRRDELEIFNPQHTERSAMMKDPLYDLIKPFMYDDRDRNSFFTPMLQHELKISSRTAAAMKANCRLKVHSFDKGRANYVAVLLDPVRLFHNMATPIGNHPPFIISIEKTEQIKGGNFRYHFRRIPKGKHNKNKKDVDIQHHIMQAVTNRN